MTFDYDPLQAARDSSLRLRDELLDMGWPTAAELKVATDEPLASAQARLATLREDGRLLGAWSLRDGTFRYPSFQFIGLNIRPRTADLLRALHLVPGLAPELDRGGWRRVFWLYGATGELSEAALHLGPDTTARAPADVFVIQPEAVIAYALAEGRRDDNSAW